MKTISAISLFCIAIVGSSFLFTEKKITSNKSVVTQNSDTLSSNYLMIGEHKWILNIDNKIDEFSDKNLLFENIKDNRVQISKSQLNIVLAETRNDKNFVLELLGLFRVADIKNFKVMSPNQFKNPNYNFPPVEDEKMVIIKNTAKIEVNDRDFEISLEGVHLKSKDIGKIEEFIKKNLDKIKNTQILIIGKASTSYDKSKPIFDLLKKYDLYNFKLISR